MPSPKKKKPKNHQRKPRSLSFYKSWEWRKLRYKVLLKYDRKCMCCGDFPPTCKLIIDHIKPRSKYPELELKESNLQVLCNVCNMGKSNIDETDFTVDARLVDAAENHYLWGKNL